MEILQHRGAPSECYVLSAGWEEGARSVPLRDALNEVVGSSFGTIVSCIHGKLGYYEGEDPGHRKLLWNPRWVTNP